VPERSKQSFPADLTISTGMRVPAKYQMPERRPGPFRLVYPPDNNNELGSLLFTLISKNTSLIHSLAH